MRDDVTSSLICWAHAQNDPCLPGPGLLAPSLLVELGADGAPRPLLLPPPPRPPLWPLPLPPPGFPRPPPRLGRPPPRRFTAVVLQIDTWGTSKSGSQKWRIHEINGDVSSFIFFQPDWLFIYDLIQNCMIINFGGHVITCTFSYCKVCMAKW